MPNRVITVDFGKKCGRVKPLNAINGGPLSACGQHYDVTEQLLAMGVPYVRTSDTEASFGNRYVNIHCVFPDFSANEELAESYNFAPTDAYLSAIRRAGAGIFLRLGESPEHYDKKLFVHSPRDKEKWARVCEHIIMHYNEGWADGFKLAVKQVEIWSGADSKDGFVGEAEEYFELYSITAKHLKQRFPKIKIGGYGAGGFYSLNRIGTTDEEKNYVAFMEKFLSYTAKSGAPLDFFSWCCHTSSPEELSLHAKYARSYLDAVGFKRAKSIICEYNTQHTGVPGMSVSFPSELCASLILAQKGEVDMMMYSSSDPYSRDNGLFTIDDHVSPHHYAAYNVMCAFGRLYKLGTAVETAGDYRKEVYSIAARGASEGSVLAVTRQYSGKVEIVLSGSDFDTCDVLKITAGGSRGAGALYRADGLSVIGGRIVIPAKENEVFLIKLYNK